MQLAQRQVQMTPIVSTTTTSGIINPAYETNQTFNYPQHPPTYSNVTDNNMPPSYSQLGYLQGPMTK